MVFWRVRGRVMAPSKLSGIVGQEAHTNTCLAERRESRCGARHCAGGGVYHAVNVKEEALDAAEPLPVRRRRRKRSHPLSAASHPRLVRGPLAWEREVPILALLQIS